MSGGGGVSTNVRMGVNLSGSSGKGSYSLHIHRNLIIPLYLCVCICKNVFIPYSLLDNRMKKMNCHIVSLKRYTDVLLGRMRKNW